MPVNLGNLINLGLFPKIPGICEIPQISGNLGNSPIPGENLRVVYFSIIGNIPNA